MIWRFSDGTTVELGGMVEGPTLLAQRLRADLAQPQVVTAWPPPGGDVELDAGDPALLEAWLRSELRYWADVRGLALTLKSPTGIPPLPRPPWAGSEQETGAGVVY